MAAKAAKRNNTTATRPGKIRTPEDLGRAVLLLDHYEPGWYDHFMAAINTRVAYVEAENALIAFRDRQERARRRTRR